MLRNSTITFFLNSGQSPTPIWLLVRDKTFQAPSIGNPPSFCNSPDYRQSDAIKWSHRNQFRPSHVFMLLFLRGLAPPYIYTGLRASKLLELLGTCCGRQSADGVDASWGFERRTSFHQVLWIKFARALWKFNKERGMDVCNKCSNSNSNVFHDLTQPRPFFC